MNHSRLSEEDAQEIMETKADWLRSEIEKLEGDKKHPMNGESTGDKEVDIAYIGYNTALTSIITRYKEELKVLESK